jgi:hypothetical protein
MRLHLSSHFLAREGVTQNTESSGGAQCNQDGWLLPGGFNRPRDSLTSDMHPTEPRQATAKCPRCALPQSKRQLK